MSFETSATALRGTTGNVCYKKYPWSLTRRYAHMEKHQNDLRRGWPRQIARGEPQPEQRNSFEHIAPCSTQAPSLGLYSTLSSPTLTVMCTRPNSMSVDMAEAELTRNACDLGQAAKRPSAKSECSGAQPSLWETPHFGRSKSGIDRDLYLSISIYTYLSWMFFATVGTYWDHINRADSIWRDGGPLRRYHLARRGTRAERIPEA